MGDLHRIDLRAIARDDGIAGASARVGVWIGRDEVASFPAPPSGESVALGRCVSIPWPSGACPPISLAVNGANAWRPREAIVSARYSEPGSSPWPCAVAVSRPSFDDSGSFDLARFRQAMDTDLLDQFLLVTTTERANPLARGALELTVRASIGGVPLVAFQTVLPNVGRQLPGQAGDYLYRFQIPAPGIPSALLHSVAIGNRSDEVWRVAGAELYGWSVDARGRPVGGLLADGPRRMRIGQDVACRSPEHGASDTYRFDLLDRPLALP